jgi:uncharacterized membrane protein
MNFPLAIVFGIIAMFGWGLADFLVATVVKKASVFRTFFWTEMVSTFFYAVTFLFFFKLPVIPGIILVTVGLCSFLHVLAYLALYKSLQVGKISVVAPISASWVVVTVLLCVVFLKEALTGLQALGVALVISAILLVSFRWRDLRQLRLKNPAAGVSYALVALVSFGVQFTLVDYLVAELSWFVPIFLIKSLALPILLASSGTLKGSISLPKIAALVVVLIGLLEFIAGLGYGLGVDLGYTAIVAPVTASSPLVTVILARIFFKERVEVNQKVGILFFLLGLALLSA